MRGFAGIAVTTFVVSSVVLARMPVPAQGASAAAKAEKTLVPLKVVVTLARYEGEKKTSSLPFTLWVNANDDQPTTLNMVDEVAYPTTVSVGATGPAAASYSYRTVGTNITCRAASLEDGRFRINLTVGDSSMSPSKDAGGRPSFQSFTAQNYLLLRDGQTAQYVAATDKVTGEVTRVEVNVVVLK